MLDTFIRLERDGRYLVRVDGIDIGTYKTCALACIVFFSTIGCTPAELVALVQELT